MSATIRSRPGNWPTSFRPFTTRCAVWKAASANRSAEPLKPAVPIRKSVTPEYLICLEDGKKLKMLKRHLRSTYNLSPDEYRAKWGLPPDYPMVAPKYAEQRSEFAKKIGLGRGTGRNSAPGRRARNSAGAADHDDAAKGACGALFS